MERESVLDRYFNDIIVERLELEEDGWGRINDKPRLWREEHKNMSKASSDNKSDKS
jgi:hypothetical protein